MENIIYSYCKERSSIASIILESTSQNTIENALNCYHVIMNDESLKPTKCSVVTSDFHIPRTRCIFNSIFSSSSSSANLRTTSMCYIPSDSYLEKSLYRPLSLRPKDIDLWSLLERLDIELLAIDKLPDDMKRYGFTISNESIISARKEIQALRKEQG